MLRGLDSVIPDEAGCVDLRGVEQPVVVTFVRHRY